MELDNAVLDTSEIAWFIRMKSGLDITRYRPACFRRRIAHRMSIIGCASIDEYLGRLTSDTGELERLVDAVTIHVTQFFRDRDVFEALERDLVPERLARKAATEPGVFRVWSAGCSTGEETYSIAMMLKRAASSGTRGWIEVFGTDVSESACQTARAGLFHDERMGGLPARLRNRYFSRQGDQWRAGRELRELVKFRPHDLFSPAPYSMLDMIFCRNVLIHFEQNARNIVMDHFHTALAAGGLLVLGKSEALSSRAEQLFELVDPRFKIYRKRTAKGPSGEDRK